MRNMLRALLAATTLRRNTFVVPGHGRVLLYLIKHVAGDLTNLLATIGPRRRRQLMRLTSQ